MENYNFHTHCNYCDGEGELLEYVLSAMEKNFYALGFSSHAPLPFPVDWVMQEHNLLRYCEEVRSLKARYADRLQVYLGLEIDFIEGIVAATDTRWKELELDFVVGSVHFVQSDRTERQMEVDGPIEEFTNYLQEGFDGNAKKLALTYFQNLKKMIIQGGFDILGHFDVVTKNNGKGHFFDTAEDWYRGEILECLDLAASKDVIVELNTGALARGYQDVIYPHPDLLPICREKNIRTMINADAHDPRQVDFAYDRAISLLKEAGYHEQWVLKDGSWTSVPLR